nr:tRNA pseudouridine(55) synthase TruB [Wenzhouxiangella limi]
MVSGILLLDKPVGLSSNAALGRAKHALGMRKAGHTGTLDPLASGLLVLCFGEATKVAGYLLDGDKTYRAEVRLGVTTETDDAEGAVVESRPVPVLDEEAVERALAGFRGAIEQVPPMYSALKRDGERLYQLARRGETVERPARAVTVHDLVLLSRKDDRIELRVRCSKGTYIRSLARDLGEQLGCGAHLSALRRTHSEPFDIADAVDLEALLAMDSADARARLKPPDQALLQLPAIELDPDQAARVLNGQRLAGLATAAEGLVRLYAPQGFIGIGQSDGRGALQPKRLFRVALD